ncbi:MAG TPA: hypothetical protein PLF40_09640 [Kofleriaceae bacterium]|nr:hypothetical protein [Kofleriaceae bacterium]
MSEAATTALVPLWIDRATGQLVVADQLRLQGGMTAAAALACLANLAPTWQKRGTMHSTVTVRGLALGGLPAHLICSFTDDTLRSVTFGVVLPDPELIDGWPSRATSEREVMVIRDALRGMLGPDFAATQTFHWGDVYAGIQDREGTAHAGIRYAAM